MENTNGAGAGVAGQGSDGAVAPRVDVPGFREMWRGVEWAAENQRRVLSDASSRMIEIAAQWTTLQQRAVASFDALAARQLDMLDGVARAQSRMAELMESAVAANPLVNRKLGDLANPGAFIELQRHCAGKCLDMMLESQKLALQSVFRVSQEALRSPEEAGERRAGREAQPSA